MGIPCGVPSEYSGYAQMGIFCGPVSTVPMGTPNSKKKKALYSPAREFQKKMHYTHRLANSRARAGLSMC